MTIEANLYIYSVGVIIGVKIGVKDKSAKRARLALRLKPIIAAKAKENQAEYHGNQYETGLCQKSDKVQMDTKRALLLNSAKAVNTTEEIAKAAGGCE